MLPIVFMSNEQGAPTLNNAAGSLISVLKACLVTGFNNVGITSVTIAGNVATVVTTANHGLTVGQRATVAGVSITAANGDKTVASVPNVTTFTYPCVNSDVSEGPVSASVKRTPLGWVEQFSKTNVSMFKSSDPAAYGQSLRVDDTSTTTGARVIGVENPTGIDTWTDKFPLETQMAGGGYWMKGAYTAAAKAWCIVGDERFFYFLVENSTQTDYYGANSGNSQYWSFNPFHFGDIVSYKNSESFGAVLGCMLGTGGTSNSQQSSLLVNNDLGTNPGTVGHFIARQQSAVTKSVYVGTSFFGGQSPGVAALPRYPSPVDNGLIITEPVLVSEFLAYANNPVRGVMPGLAGFMCYGQDLPQNPFPMRMTTTDGSNRTYLYAPRASGISPNSNECIFAVKLSEAWR